MSYGNCCLTSDIPECADVIREYGVTFEQRSVEDLRNTLQRLCDDFRLVAKYKEKSADYICGKYNWDDVAKQTLQLYGVNEEPISTAPVEEKEYERDARR